MDFTKAETTGRDDAETWLAETADEDWDGAIAPGCLGADEALLNALGVRETLRVLGCYDSAKQSEFFHAYSVAWANRVYEAIATRDGVSL